MPIDRQKLDRHLVQWKHNRSLIPKVPASHPDWIVTVVFYTAVQAVDAALAFEEATAWNHDTRFQALGTIHRLSKVGKLYHTLYNLSRTVRYSANPDLWVAPRSIDAKVVRGHLLPLEQSVQNLIGRDMQLPPLDMSYLVALTS